MYCIKLPACNFALRQNSLFMKQSLVFINFLLLVSAISYQINVKSIRPDGMSVPASMTFTSSPTVYVFPVALLFSVIFCSSKSYQPGIFSILTKPSTVLSSITYIPKLLTDETCPVNFSPICDDIYSGLYASSQLHSICIAAISRADEFSDACVTKVL